MVIVLDAGHGGMDPGVMHLGRLEKEDALHLTLATGKVLEEKGYHVVYTRTDDVYFTPYQKVQLANKDDSNVLISIHRNATPNGSGASGMVSFVYKDSGVSSEMARNINRYMEKLGFLNLGVKERPDLVLLRQAKVPAVILAVGFVESEKDNYMFDTSLNQIAQAIAVGIMETLSWQREKETYYRVQTGTFKKQEYARQLQHELQAKRYPAYVEEMDGLYKVQVGGYGELENAILMEKTLRQNGYDTYLTTK